MMKLGTYLLYLLVGYLASAGLAKAPLDSGVDTPYSANALLNDSVWFGKALAYYHHLPYDKPCTNKQFSLHILTDLPHAKESLNRGSSLTGCMKPCLPTQTLSISGVPLRLGRYSLSSLPCCNGSPDHAAYTLLAGGDVSVGDYEGYIGWLEVTKYSATMKEIDGKFEVSLRNSQGELIHFRQGVFRAKLTTY